MKRRLTIARSLVNGPGDPPARRARRPAWIRRRGTSCGTGSSGFKRQGVTLVLTTHYMDEAEQLCDRLVVMDAGKIVAEGSPRSLIERYSTREVLELRFDHEVHDDAGPALAHLAERVEVLPDRVLLYVDDGDTAAEGVQARGLRPLSVLVRRSTLETSSCTDRPLAGRLRGTDERPHHRVPTAGLARLAARPRVGAFWRRSLQYWLTSYRRTWRGTVVGRVSSRRVLYLGAMGFGLGSLIDKGGTSAVDGVPYVVFVAPGVLAATAMQTAVGESTYPSWGR